MPCERNHAICVNKINFCAVPPGASLLKQMASKLLPITASTRQKWFTISEPASENTTVLWFGVVLLTHQLEGVCHWFSTRLRRVLHGPLALPLA